MSRQMISANGLVICKKCAMKSYLQISKEQRPLASQWVVYKDVHSDSKCAMCGS